MRVDVVAVGPTLADVTTATIRDLRKVNRAAGKALGKVGTDAINAGAPTMFGKRLRGKATVETWPDRLEVEFHAAKGQAGAWQIQETGARPHDIKPRKKKALAIVRGDPGWYAAVVDHPGARGRRQWTAAGERLIAAIGDAAQRLYDNGLGAR